MSEGYSIVYADPPWEVQGGPRWSGISGPSKPLPYPTMTVEEIKQLPVKELAAKDAHLYLWTINKYVEQAYAIARSWGFSVSCMLTWCKPRHGLGIGGAFVQTTEYLLFCRRGALETRTRVDTTWFLRERLRHSEKPSMFRDMIVKVSGDLPRIELFAREEPDGWDVWGNEVGSGVELSDLVGKPLHKAVSEKRPRKRRQHLPF